MSPDRLEIIRRGQSAEAEAMREGTRTSRFLNQAHRSALAGASFPAIRADCFAFVQAQRARIHWGKNVDARIAYLEVRWGKPQHSLVRPVTLLTVAQEAAGWAADVWKGARRGPVPA